MLEIIRTGINKITINDASATVTPIISRITIPAASLIIKPPKLIGNAAIIVIIGTAITKT